MKNLLFVLAIFIFSSCEKGEESTFIASCEECNEWERCTNISQDFFGFEMTCRPKLKLYTGHGHWSGELNVLDETGNTYIYELENLKAITQGLQNISINFPENGLASNLILNFINSETLEFTINDMVYDPHVQSNVLYNGTGQLIHTGGSADTVLEFNCDFTFENKNYSVSFSASRY